MLFNSLEFAIFFSVFLALYYLTPTHRRWVPLLIASYIFYMSWRVDHVLLILATTVVTYATGLWMSGESNQRKRLALMLVGIGTNLAILFVFKYLDFFFGSLNAMFQQLQVGPQLPFMKLALPIGISFYTFKSLSYTFDVYRQRIQPERNFGIFALYVSFFPQLIAGPIERAGKLIPQFRQISGFDWAQFVSGLSLILWGLFKKLVVADRLAIVVNQVYNNPTAHNGPTLLIGTVFFAFQIYCDFSGYSDIAVGIGRILGFDLTENFNLPYRARSISEFWRRWHISLSTWFRDYVYLPLGGNRVPLRRWMLNIMVVFLVSGLWHGASWTFVVWGFLHGLFMAVESLWLRSSQRSRVLGLLPASMWSPIQLTVTFLLVSFAWIFFRANSLADAWFVVTHLLDFSTLQLGVAWSDVILGIVAIGLLQGLEIIQTANRPNGELVLNRRWMRWGYVYVLIFSILLLGVFSNAQFIYAQF